MKKNSFLLLFLSTQALAVLDPEQVRLGCRHQVMDMASNAIEKRIESPILPNDRAEDLVDEPEKMIKSLKKMDERRLQVAKTFTTPWSDTYWPLMRGGLGQRYADKRLLRMDWKEARNYVTKHPAETLISSGKTNLLSPAEKYDYLLGLKHYPLTASNWSDGESFYRSYGKVESWMGLCHGWAPASIMMAEPKKKVVVGNVPFNPSDVKGLATLLWAKGEFPTKFIGGRCNSKTPEDREADCLDNNPGTWHLAVVNQIGVSRRSLIMDANYSYEVWNHPVYGYQYSYYNPQTGKDVRFFQDAVVPVEAWSDDPLKKLRSKNAAFIVGIKMTVNYAVENLPSDLENQTHETAFVDYQYDLELNKDQEVIGGEWYSAAHPDFLWVPERGSFPQTYGDSEGLEVTFPLASNLQKDVEENAENGVPFGAVVRKLVNLSK